MIQSLLDARANVNEGRNPDMEVCGPSDYYSRNTRMGLSLGKPRRVLEAAVELVSEGSRFRGGVVRVGTRVKCAWFQRLELDHD